jgi:UDP:flavonoid glycosyltransferase YjiC (YdhE family)
LERDGYSEIRNAIEKLLSDPSYSEAARRLQDTIETQPTPADVVGLIA